MNQFLFVFLGSGLGGVIRYGLTLALTKYSYKLPIHTLSANIIASFIIGICMGYLMNTENNWLRYFIAIGFCGGLSTYSSFSYEIFQQYGHQDWICLILYISLTFTLCLLSVFLGVLIMK